MKQFLVCNTDHHTVEISVTTRGILDIRIELKPGESLTKINGIWVTKPHDCLDIDLQRVDHEVNTVDWSHRGSGQSYQVYRCKVCKDYWGVRHQYDDGTGHDDRSKRFGPDITTVERHY